MFQHALEKKMAKFRLRPQGQPICKKDSMNSKRLQKIAGKFDQRLVVDLPKPKTVCDKLPKQSLVGAHTFNLAAIKFCLQKYTASQQILKLIIKDKILCITFEDDQGPLKLEIKSSDIKNKNSVFCDFRNGSITFVCTNISFKRFINNNWVVDAIDENGDLTIDLKNKVEMKKFIEIPFYKNIQQCKIHQLFTKRMPKNDEDGDWQAFEQPIFQVPTPKQLKSTQRQKKLIQLLPVADKEMILMEVYKIKKEPIEKDNNNLKKNMDQISQTKCPIFFCAFSCQQPSQLKVHVDTFHPELQKNGIRVSVDGQLRYNERALNLALYLGKFYPEQMKKLIKLTKLSNTV